MSSVSEIAGLQTSKYANIGGLAILIFDYCITFQDEVKLTWSRPWDITRIIFTISRYLPFVGIALTAHAALHVSGPCPPNLEENIIHIVSIVAAEGLLLLRTWAFWERSKKLLIGLLIYAAVTITAAVVVNRNPTPLIPGTEPTGCFFEASRNGAVVYSILAIYECVILFLTAYKRFHDYKDFRSSIVTTIYCDGMIYILCIITITVTNVIVGIAFPIAYSDMFDTLQIVIHSVLASRILFRLRSSNDRTYETPLPLTLDNIQYHQPSHSQETGAESEV
ncbi:hypothetical protein K503DRAFT_770312 [Rhizopogon vinicolor AM-OR11-026]|uniref:DUF6533 domain-containing protein n=1 Tax=Rhizopogon vinicolor AM-OR11-026 TaxID=1314800 RepID=A0A1B7N179_9AGAM|nr:hypothetical protein K503DRAFT_770312 [Rhizopogon vinicolor AM-OR11-026]